MVPKSGDNYTECIDLALLLIMPKLSEKLIKSRLKLFIENYQLIPFRQFCFHHNHSTIDQVHRITDLIRKCLTEESTTTFLDIA